MPSTCCIKNCQNNNKKGFHLFRFPLNRKDHLKKWTKAIGEKEFKPSKNHVICSKHFTPDDFMDRPGTSSIRLKNLAVPSIFLKASVTAPMIVSTLAPTTAPTFENALASVIHSHIDRLSTSSICLKNLTVPSIFLKTPVTAPVIASILAPATAPTSENVFDLAIHLQTVTSEVTSFKSSEQKENENNFTVSSLLSENTASISPIDNTIKMTLVKKRKLMNNSYYHLKNQEMSPRKKQMKRIIQTLKQKLTRKEKKIQSLQCLLADLRYDM
ncbi:THAP domain-containing protein 5 [Cyphomyrmex costatus]|uniref:THAP domain-containing protein 5 n=1 Tax=Cyphomyrmex costatus TaxID=456900 RepID=A0A151I803_9HYME|nr:THAP domain-containing protein 5 [Cyphomyrmex costatus]